MVRAVGIEPTLLAERDFESRASTNSTTPALRQAYNVTAARRNENIKNANYAFGFIGFFEDATDFGRALRTLTAEASILFFKCRP